VTSETTDLGRVLVTGADGFIGSHLSEALLRGGAQVRAFTFYNALGSRGWLDSLAPEVTGGLEVVAGDVRDPSMVRTAMRGCDTVLHLAALIAIPYSYGAPDSYLETNVRGTLNILQAARELGIRKVVHTSTSEVYGSAQYVPIDEGHPLQAQSPYAASKIAADQFALSFYRSYGLPVAVIRPFNTYGPRQSARAVIPTVITQIAAGSRTIKLGALEPTRDFNFVQDTVAGFIAVARANNSTGEVINIGSNFEVSIGETATLIAEVMGERVEVVCDAERLRPEKSEVQRLWADTRKAEALLGWRPLYGGLEGFRRGLAETVAWFTDKDHLKGYRTDVYTI
jgi:dTDP-glucose 4,6-dehydratase